MSTTGLVPGMQESTVKVYALQAGHFTLPERFFVHPASAMARRTVPSLAFLIEHQERDPGKITRIVFDLGLRRDVTNYAEPIREHIKTRQPLTTDPDVTKSLSQGGLAPRDIDFVIYSHVSTCGKFNESKLRMFKIHWDHIGEPSDFDQSTFVVGHGSLALFNRKPDSLHGSHAHFESDLLPRCRTVELSDPSAAISETPQFHDLTAGPDFNQRWRAHGILPKTLDLFNDGSLYIADAPGHLPGHINILASTAPNKQVYLAGDTCHDRRIVRGEKEIGEWQDSEGHLCCIHADKKQAEATVERIRQLESQGVEVIFAHDFEWEENALNQDRFLGGLT